jgi:hypothetical protein
MMKTKITSRMVGTLWCPRRFVLKRRQERKGNLNIKSFTSKWNKEPKAGKQHQGV